MHAALPRSTRMSWLQLLVSNDRSTTFGTLSSKANKEKLGEMPEGFTKKIFGAIKSKTISESQDTPKTLSDTKAKDLDALQSA